jgi:hypothetical protein
MARRELFMRRHLGICRILITLQLCCILVATGGMASLRGQERADKKVEELADASRARAEGVQVSVAAGGRTTKAAVHGTPLMKYTDVPRPIEMATLWVWEDDGLPVALGKVEAYRRKEGTKWLYCFASVSTGLVEAKWPDGRLFQARKPGLEWATIKGPAPQETAAGRRRQMKELFLRFSATTRGGVSTTSEELRPLARPLHEYSSPKQGVVQGVLCGFAANGTNPDIIVALEAVSMANDKDPPSWRYGVIRMTTSGVAVKLDKSEVFTREFVKSLEDRDEWTHFWEGAAKK